MSRFCYLIYATMVLLNLRALALTITTKTRLQPSSTLTKRTLAPLGNTFAFGDIRTPSYDRNFSLFASGNNQANEVSFATKDRQEELQKLATTLDVDTSKVKDLLKQQALKPNLDPERTKYIQWLLGSKSKSAPATQQESPPPPAQQQSVQNANLHSSTKFNDIESLHPMTKKAIAEMLPHEYMTDIQAQTYHVATTGKDVLGRARTGTGKTLAFLLPALQCILDGTNAYKNGKMIGIVVISPTRELATQIGDQAQKLIQHHPELSCMVMYGGTNMKRDITRLNKKLPTILVTTPGRFIDHLENTSLGGQKFGHDIMRLTSTLVLDEADRLMDMGFQKAIQTIMKYLPAKDNRQTLLFSATVPKDVKLVMANYMSHDYVEVDCIGGSGDSEFENESHTNIQVQQSHVVLPTTDHYVTSVVQIVKEFQKQKDHKLVVFFSTARAVGFFAAFFNQGLGIDVFELHSRKKQGYRDRVSKQFRNSKSGILFTSDVSARGVDYPDITGVIQFGLPESRDQYIHRLGRTGRAGKEGKGILVLAPFEKKFVSESLGGLDVPANGEITQLLNAPLDEEMEHDVSRVLNRIRSGDAILTLSAQQAYQAFIGYYRGHLKKTSLKSAEQLVDVANEYARHMGLKEVPGITKKAARNMGIINLPNIRIAENDEFTQKKQGGRSNNNGRRR